MGRFLRLCLGANGTNGCLNRDPLKITVLKGIISYLAVLQHRWVYICKPCTHVVEIERAIKFDAISSTFNKLFDNLIGFM